jgi:hypothetical protein
MTLLVIMWAVVPLAIYFLWIGCLQLRSRPTVVSGFADTLWLGLGLSGLMIVGPGELFLPESASNRFGWFAHLLLVVLYALLLILTALTRKPQIVVYNATSRQLQPALSEALKSADAKAVFLGSSALLPTLGVDLSVNLQEDSRTVQLSAISREVDMRHWRRLRSQLSNSLRTVQGSANPRAAGLICAGIAALAIVTYIGVTDWPTLARGLQQWLDR